MLWSTGEGGAFLSGFEFFDKQAAKGILYQTLATEEASFGTRAQGSIHETILETIVRQAKRSVCRMAFRDILTGIVEANAGADKRRLTPRATLGDAETQNLPALWAAAAQLQRAGYFDGSQLPEVDELLNLPPRMAGVAGTMQPTTTPAADPAPMPAQPGQPAGDEEDDEEEAPL
jgi:phage gp29-like protein